MKGRIYSIGYEGLSFHKLQEILDRNHIDELIDVRDSPDSNWLEDFRLPNFKRAMGDNYHWYGHILGGLVRKNRRRRMGAYNELMEKVRSGKRICLMCTEKDPDVCHRKNDLAKDFNVFFGEEVFHLNGDGDIIPKTKLLDWVNDFGKTRNTGNIPQDSMKEVKS